MNIWSLLGYLFLIAAGGVAIVAAFHLQKKYPLRFVRLYLYSLLFSYAYAFLDIIGRYLALRMFSATTSEPAVFETVALLFRLLSFPFLILAWFFFIAMALEMLDRAFPLWARVVYLVAQTAFFLVFAVNVNTYLVSPDAAAIPFIATLLGWYWAINHLGLMVFSFWVCRRAKDTTDEGWRRTFRVFFAFYGAVFLLFFLLVDIIQIGVFSCYSFPVLQFFMHLPPLLYLWKFMETYYLTHPLQPLPEENLASFFGRYQISDRELEVIRLILEGKSNRQIEDQLFISIKTVKTHVYNIYRKLGINNRWQLINLVQNLQQNGGDR
jgi:DNA-binding CsgD family transcriptional regulator